MCGGDQYEASLGHSDASFFDLVTFSAHHMATRLELTAY